MNINPKPNNRLTIISNNSNVCKISWQLHGLQNADSLDYSTVEWNQDQEHLIQLAASFPVRFFPVERDHTRDGCQWNQSSTCQPMRWWRHAKRSADVTCSVAEMRWRVVGCRSRHNLHRCSPSETAANPFYSHVFKSDWKQHTAKMITVSHYSLCLQTVYYINCKTVMQHVILHEFLQ